MKKIYLIVGLVVIAIVLAIRFGLMESTGAADERQWFAENLHYEFTAEVDSARALRGEAGPGKIWCRVTTGNPDVGAEDSLERKLEKYKSLAFVTDRSDNIITCYVTDAHRYLPGDSVIVSSSSNRIEVFRSGKSVFTESLSAQLEGRGTMFMF